MERNPHDDSDEEELVDIVTAPESDHSYAESDIDVIYVEDEGTPMDTYVAELVTLEPNRESSPSHPSVINLTPNHPQPIGEDEVMPPLITDIVESNEQSNQSVNEDDGQTCTICFEPWTNSNEHRLVSLRCGHLFGRSCITRWLKGQARCPQCNARARKSEIRNIYAKSVKVIDTLERDKALEELQKERQAKRNLELSMAQEKVRHMLCIQDCEKLKKQLFETNKLLRDYRLGSKLSEASQPKAKVPLFSLEKCIEISKPGGCRIVDVCDLLGMILVSQPSPIELFTGYGVRKINSLDMRPSEFVLIHQKPLRDMAFHCHDGLVLTASLDKTVKITNVLTNSVVQSYTHDSDAWSCAWDLDDPKYFYAGFKTGAVYLHDIRMTDRYVLELPRFGNKTPAVSIQYIKRPSCSSFSKCGPAVGKLSDCAFYNKPNQEDGEYKVVPLPTMGPYTSLSAEQLSGHFLVSSRPSPKQSRVTHTVCELVTDQRGDDLVCNPVQVIRAGRTQLQLTKSKLLPHPDDPSSLLICAGDEDAHGALIWDGSSGYCIDNMKTESAVLDIVDVKVDQKPFLMSLTDRMLRIFSWNN